MIHVAYEPMEELFVVTVDREVEILPDWWLDPQLTIIKRVSKTSFKVLKVEGEIRTLPRA